MNNVFPCLPRYTIWALILMGFAMSSFLNCSIAAAKGSNSSAGSSSKPEVYTRSVPNSNIKEVTATIVINAAPEKVFAVLLASDKFTEFMPYVEEVNKVNGGNPDTWYLYQRINLRLPLVDDRDYILRHKKIVGPQPGRYELHWEAVNDHGPAPKAGITRVNLCTGSYKLESLNGGTSTRVTYQLHTDPGGNLSGFVNIMDFANKKSVPELMQAIANRVANPNYRRP